MAGNLHVAFGDPEGGTVRLTVTSGGDMIEVWASYVYNGFLELTLTLHRLLFMQGESVVTWQSDGGETEMRFLRIEDAVYLEIEQFPDGRHPGRGQRRLLASGNYDSICLPFWRALRALQGRLSEGELQRRWPGFPSNEIEKLTTAIEQQSKPNAGAG